MTPILLHEAYAYELRIHAVTLIFLGYRRLALESLSTADEDDITGELIRNIRAVTFDPISPEWVDRYEVREQVPQNIAGKFGKRRPRIDIEIERHVRGPRPCLGFEAKRLGRGALLSDYLGEEGLGAFLSGHYPSTHGDAGMLGYVQENSADHWTSKLITEFTSGRHQIAAGGELKELTIIEGVPFHHSLHTDLFGNPLRVVHLILPFAV